MDYCKNCLVGFASRPGGNAGMGYCLPCLNAGAYEKDRKIQRLEENVRALQEMIARLNARLSANAQSVVAGPK